MGDKTKGLYGKFVVRRTDGRDQPGEKHDGCEYFVLDLSHDPHAYRALMAYAASCSEEYPLLAGDLRAKAMLMREDGVSPATPSLEDLQTLVAEGRAFVSDGRELDRWVEHQENACPVCGGSGHKDDAAATATAWCGARLVDACHGAAYAAGWWHDLRTGEDMRGKRNVPELLCLIHSEISEAMEGHRKGLMDDKLPHRPMLEVELADAAIRIFDLAGGFGLDIGGAIAEKLAYNAKRADHKPENRLADGGKAY